MVIRDLLKKESEILSGSPSAALFEVEILAAHLLGISRSSLLLKRNEEFPSEKEAELHALVSRRKMGEPSAYLVGEKEFMGLPFLVGEGVLIPRPDTETLVEWAIDTYKGASPRVLDICTGSGAIAVSVAHFLPESKVSACDISETALAFAEKNAKENGVSVSFSKKDILKEEIEGTYDLILSNPPYIPQGEIPHLMVDVKDYEPHLALIGGEDGLLFYPIIIKKAYSALAEGGRLAVEIGFDQGEAVKTLMEEYFKNAYILKDLAGNDRVVVGEK